MRFLRTLILAGAMASLPALADPDPDSLPTPPNLHLLDEGSGDGFYRDTGWTPDGKTFGLGLQVGFPTALTLEVVTSSGTSLVAGLGIFGYRFFTPAPSFYLDYLWHPGTLGRTTSLALSWHVGVGGWVMIYDNSYVYTGTPMAATPTSPWQSGSRSVSISPLGRFR